MPTTQALDHTVAARRRLGARLTLGALVAAVLAVPFTLLAVLVFAQSELLETWDRGVADTLHRAVLPRPGLTRTLEVLALVTHPNTLRAVAGVIAIVLWVRGRQRLVAWLVVTMTAGGLLSPALKEVVARARPTFDEPVTTAGGYSFPSGHALNSMLFTACLVVLAHPVTRGGRRALLWAGAVLLVLVTGLDRIALGVHYASDVLAGWVVALATVAATTIAFATWRRHEGLPASSAERGLDPEPAPPPAPSARRWPRLLGGLLVLRWAAVLVVLVATGLLVTRVADHVWPLTVEDAINRGLAAGRSPAGNTASALMSSMGNTSTVVTLCLLAFVVLRVVLKRWREPLFVAAVTLGQSVVFVLTTMAVDRPRPDVQHLDDSPPTSSFPSGHTSAAVALYVSLAIVAHRRLRTAWLRRVVMAFLLCLPAMVAIGRLYRGMHHPSDVTGSLLNAGLILFLTDRLLRATPLPDDGEAPVAAVTAPGAGSEPSGAGAAGAGAGAAGVASPGGDGGKDGGDDAGRVGRLVERDPGAARQELVALVLNPVKVSDADALTGQLRERCRADGRPDPLVLVTTPEDPGRGQAREARDAGAGVVLAAGGDGTVRAVAEGLAGTGIPLAVLPQGTGNLLARNLDLPLDLDDALDLALHGEDRAIDVCRLDEAIGDSEGTVFAVMAGAGLDAAMMQEAPEGLKSAVGWPAYLVGGVRGLRRAPVRIDVSLDGGPPIRARVRTVLVANLGTLQGGLCLAPDARPDDGLLDVVLVSPTRPHDWIVLVARGLTRRTRTDRRLRTYQATHVTIRMHRTQPRQVDGDLIADGVTLAARVEPGGLVLRFPPSAAPAADAEARDVVVPDEAGALSQLERS